MADDRALILGLGNTSRQDDGFGWYAVNAVRARLGQALLGETDDGMDDLGQVTDSAFLPQLSSDLADVLADYARLVIVDARVGGAMVVHWEEVESAAPDRARLLTHNMVPRDLLAVARALWGQAPRAFLVSVPGVSFDFGVGLTGAVAALVDEAADLCLALARGAVPSPAGE